MQMHELFWRAFSSSFIIIHSIDISPSTQPGFCGGSVSLTDSSPEFAFSSPLYDNPSTFDVTNDCWMYITSPSGKQVRLTFTGIQTTANEEIKVYDHPSSTSYQISSIIGTLNASTAMISSRGGLTIFHDDKSSSHNGRGFTVAANILGNYELSIMNKSSHQFDTDQNYHSTPCILRNE